jgi:hypothetical protein
LDHLLKALTRWELRSPQSLTALDQLARRRDATAQVREQALLGIEAHNEPREVGLLVEMLDELPERLRITAIGGLKHLTGNDGLSATGLMLVASSDWRKIAERTNNDVRRTLKDREEREAAAFAERRKTAAARLEVIRADPSNRGP